MSAPASGVILDGRYELLDHLDRGGMATVYRALDRRLDRLVAVKVLDDARRDEAGIAFREDRLTARLAHPHIVAVYDGGATPGGQPFLVMELIDGQPVNQLAPLPVWQALRIVEDVASAVAYTHERGIVHCDIKPQNVLLDAHGRAKLADFGVASADRTPGGAIVYGSAPYLAPERLHGAPVGPAVDIYALGATLYFLLSGQPPHDDPAADEMIAGARGAAPRPLADFVPDLPPAVEGIVRRAMAPDPTERYPSASALRDDLAALRRTSGETTGALHVAPVAAFGEGVSPHPPDPGATTELPDAATAGVLPSGGGATTALPRATSTGTAARANRLEELNATFAPSPLEPTPIAAGRAALVAGGRRLLAVARELPGRARAARGALGAGASDLARRATPWKARGRRLASTLGRAARRWGIPAVTALLIALVIVAGVRTLADRHPAAASAHATTAVPAVLGLGLGDARDRLTANGLAVGRIDTAPLPGQPLNVVVYQRPAAGASVAPGTAIDLVIRTAP